MNELSDSSAGSLTVVGLGIDMAGHLTPQSRDAIEASEAVFYVGCDPLAEAAITRMNPQALSLDGFYAFGRSRRETYDAMVEEVCDSVRAGNNVCFAVYGHPGVFATPTHDAVRRMTAEGYRARMVPGISATDCLYAELGLDPGDRGCQMYEATKFLERRPRFDPGVPLILWQIGTVGERSGRHGVARAGLARLCEYLAEYYPSTHEITVYHAAEHSGMRSSVLPMPLNGLPEAEFPAMSTLLVPAVV